MQKGGWDKTLLILKKNGPIEVYGVRSFLYIFLVLGRKKGYLLIKFSHHNKKYRRYPYV